MAGKQKSPLAPADRVEAENLLAFLSEKRSIRNFLPTPVGEDRIELLVQAAATAPFWGKTPCWHLIVASDPEVLERLRRASMAGLYKLNFWVRTAPVLLVGCAHPRSSRRRQGIAYYGVDTALALERASLMAHQLGLGSCWIGGFNERGVRRACRIPSGYRVVALLAVGYPHPDDASIFGVPVINDFGQYYDLIRAKYGRRRRVPFREVFSYNYFP